MAMCSVYDMFDNFSLVAEWEDTNYEVIQGLTFHNNQNDALIVLFDDATLALMSLSFESENEENQPNKSLQCTGTLEIKQVFRILNGYTDILELRYGIFTHGIETWVWAFDGNVKNIITICSIERGRSQRLEVKLDVDINPELNYLSIPQKAIMLVTVLDDGSIPSETRIWNDLDFDGVVNVKSPAKISSSQSFGFSDCGSYFLIWNYSECAESAIEVYDVRLLKTTTQPIAKRSVGHDVLRAIGQFVKHDQYSIRAFGSTSQEESPIVAFIVVSLEKVKLTVCTLRLHKTLRELDLTVKEVISLLKAKHHFIHVILDDIL